mgnify:CR=1 FL=1
MVGGGGGGSSNALDPTGFVMCPVRMCANGEYGGQSRGRRNGHVERDDGGRRMVGGSGVKKAEGDVGRPYGGVIRDEADWFEVDIFGRCGPLSERCQGEEDGVKGVAYVVGSLVLCALLQEKMWSPVGRACGHRRRFGRGGSERKAKLAFGHDAER